MELLKKEHYRNIFRLLCAYQNKGNGLKQIHFRFALEDNYKLHKYTIREMKTFFSGTLEKLYQGDNYLKDKDLPDYVYFLLFDGCRLFDNVIIKCSTDPKIINYMNAKLPDSLKDHWKDITDNSMKNPLPIRKGCITSCRNLTNFLLKLEDFNYIKRDNRNRRWKLTEHFFNEYNRQKIIANLLDNISNLKVEDLRILQSQIKKIEQEK
jgi:hypothetical protein